MFPFCLYQMVRGQSHFDKANKARANSRRQVIFYHFFPGNHFGQQVAL